MNHKLSPEAEILSGLLKISNAKVTRLSLHTFIDVIDELKGNSPITQLLRNEISPIFSKNIANNRSKVIQLKTSKATIDTWKRLLEVDRERTKITNKILPSLAGLDLKKVEHEVSEKVHVPVAKRELPFGFVSAVNFNKAQEPNTFQLPGEVGKFLGKLHRNKMAIVISGEKFGGKTTWTIEDLTKAFLEAGLSVGLLEMEQGGMENPDTFRQVGNIPLRLRSKLSVSGDQMTLDQANELAKHFDVVVVDSYQKFIGNPPASKMDELRQKNPSTIWVFIFQKNAEGGTKGGSASGFDANIVLEQMKVGTNPDDRTQNYVRIEKNRGNPTNLVYNNLQHKTYTREEYDKILYPPKVESNASDEKAN